MLKKSLVTLVMFAALFTGFAQLSLAKEEATSYFSHPCVQYANSQYDRETQPQLWMDAFEICMCQMEECL